jgi:hypothetical protein
MCDGAFRVVLVHLTRPDVNAVHTEPYSAVINRQSIWTDVERRYFRSIFHIATPFPISDWRKLKYKPEFSAFGEGGFRSSFATLLTF